MLKCRGYFPNHEDIDRTYRPHPFSSHYEQRRKAPSTPSSPTTSSMSTASSPFASPSYDTKPKPSLSALSPAFKAAIPTSDGMGFAVPLGKYHPSNYSSPSTTAAVTPTASSPSNPQYTASIAIPTALQLEPKRKKPTHERRASDVTRKVQQYQRDMIVQARLASVPKNVSTSGSAKPVSPRLLPLGSPGPITPFELEGDEGYHAAGLTASLMRQGGVEEGRELLDG